MSFWCCPCRQPMLHTITGPHLHQHISPSTLPTDYWGNGRIPTLSCRSCIGSLDTASSAGQHQIVWRLRGNTIRTALCWIVWHNVHCQQHTYMSSSYRSNRLGSSHWDPYTMRRGGCLELYYCNMMEWFWWDSSLIWTTNWFPSVL